MSASTVNVYRETLNIFINLIKTTASSSKTLINGLLSFGTNTSCLIETQVIPNGVFTAPVASTQGVVILTDQPLTITYWNNTPISGGGVQTFTSVITSVAILPGAISRFTLTNNGTLVANVTTAIV